MGTNVHLTPELERFAREVVAEGGGRFQPRHRSGAAALLDAPIEVHA